MSIENIRNRHDEWDGWTRGLTGQSMHRDIAELLAEVDQLRGESKGIKLELEFLADMIEWSHQEHESSCMYTEKMADGDDRGESYSADCDLCNRLKGIRELLDGGDDDRTT